jgi:hypothetical protein
VKPVFKYILIFLVIATGAMLLMALMKALFIFFIYSSFLGKISSTFGLDLMLARPIAILATIGSLLLLPWIISFLALGRRKKELFIATSVAVAICYMGLLYGAADVFFDRATGRPAKYYIKTLDGFKFSSTGDFDPRFGAKYRPITPEIIKEYLFWQKTGSLKTIPEVIPGRYFDMITGEPIVWYSEWPDGTVRLFPLPGHDPATGELLKPISREVVTRKYLKLGRTESNYDQARIIRLIKEGKIDLNWYFKAKENAFDLESETASLGRNRGLWGGGPWEHQFDLYVEKIIFLPPSFTIVGVCFRGAKETERIAISGCILDSRNIKHQPLDLIGAQKRNSWYEIGVSKGEVKRVFYVLEYIPPEELRTGAYSGAKEIYVKFWVKGYRKGS